jgi:hypothetical protein
MIYQDVCKLISSGEVVSWLCQVRIEGRVRINGRVIRNMKCMEGFRYRRKESGFVGKESCFVGRDQVSLEGIRFCWLHCEYGLMMV